MCALYQGVRRGEKGAIVAGGASTCRTVYEPGAGNRGHGRREAAGPLGRVAWMEGEAGCGGAIFLSVTRGPVGCRVDDDAG